MYLFRGFCVEYMAAVTVLVCGISKDFAIPVSTTHCQVGLLCTYCTTRGVTVLRTNCTEGKGMTVTFAVEVATAFPFL